MIEITTRHAGWRVAIAALALLIIMAGFARAENLLPNGSFEEGQKQWGYFVPKESEGKGCAVAISQDSPHAGTFCAEIQSDDFARHGLGSNKTLAVKPGERYQLNFWIQADKTTTARIGDGAFAVRVLCRAGNQDVPMSTSLFIGAKGTTTLQSPAKGLDLSVLSAPLPTEWAQVQSVFEIPAIPQLDNINLTFFGWYTRGIIRLDDVVLEKVDNSTPLSPVVAAPATPERTTGPVTTDAQMTAALNVDLPGMERVKAAVQANDLTAIKQTYLDYCRTSRKVKYYVMPDQKPREAAAASDQYGDEICNHYIRNIFYGFKPTAADMGKDFNWTYNPVSPSSPDFTHEWTWCAISRTQFWRLLGEAYWKTLNEKYAQEWVAQLVDFAKKCPANAKPAPSEPSLWRTLDASERMYDSWPYTYAHILSSSSFTPDAQWTYIKVVHDHIAVLKRGLSDPKRTGNWVSSESYGLLAIGVLHPELREAESCREIALQRLTSELDRQVLPDGFQAELTPGYHTFALSTFVGPYNLLKLNNLPVPSVFEGKLKAMHQALVIVMDQSGMVVPTNDAWALNAPQMARQGLKLFPGDPLLEWAATGGQKGQGLPASTMLPYAGFYTMRGGWDRNDLFLFFRGGPTGIGHEHEDMLQVVLRAWNKTLLLEPGSYSYDHSQWRYFALDTASHNTIMVDGKSQHRGPSKPEEMTRLPNPWITSPLFDFVSATYDGGYQQSAYDGSQQYSPRQWIGEKDRSISHTRRVLYLRPYYAIVLDTLDGTGTHTYDAHFNMDAPAARVDDQTLAAFSKNEGDVQIGLYPLDRDHLTTEILQGQQEPMRGWLPGQHTPIPTVRFRKQQAAPATLATLLYPYKGDQPSLTFTPMPENKGDMWAQSLRTPHENSEIILNKFNRAGEINFTSAYVGSVTSQAAALVIRQSTQDQSIQMGGWDITACRYNKWNFQLSTPATLVWRTGSDELLMYNASANEVTLKVSTPFTQTAKLTPGVWLSLSHKGTAPASAPALFKQAKAPSSLPTYADYAKGPAAPTPTGQPAHFTPETMELPKAVVLRNKIGITGKAAVGWDESSSTISLRVPKAGWYHLKMQYCAPGNPVRTLLINGVIPFAEAENFTLDSTIGETPSDGWSNFTNDWKTTTLGSNSIPSGWALYMPRDESTIALRNEAGGCNVASIELEPATGSRK